MFVNTPQLSNNLIEYGIMKPHSRVCEVEADEIGLYLMSRACFDPHASISIWQRMRAHDRYVNEYLSTHPHSSTRIANLQKLLPKAEQIRLDSGCQMVIFN
jgi:metalloendopeptidase OMA1, mitochondrial